MAVRLNLFSNTEQDTKKVSTVEELPQYMLKCIYDNNVAEESEEAKQEKMAKIKRKLEAGKKLTKEELSWLQRNDPIAYAHAIRIQMIAEEVENELKTAKSKEEANRIVSTAVSGNNLVVCLGDGTTTPAYYNASTGNKIGNVTLGSVSVASLGCMTSDSRGNILLATKATNGKSFSIYKTSSVTTAPTLLTTYTNNTGLDMGTKVSVQGDINTNASIIATCDGTASSGSNKFVRWIITDGVLGSPQVVTVNGVGNWGAPASNTKVVTKGTTAQSDYFLSYYDSNILYWVNGTNNNASKSLEDSDNGNSWAMNNNCLDTRSFNNAQYLVLVCTAHFPQWGGTPCLYMYDVTSDGSFTGTISTSDALSFNPSLSSYNSSDGVAATGDVLLAPTTDGYKLRAYYVDNNCKVIGGYEFDCIDK